MLIEGALLSAVGALVGLGLCLVAINLFVRGITGTGEPFWISVRIDTTVLLFVCALVAIAAIASTLVPALGATRVDLNTVLKDEGRANTGVHMGRFSRGLVVGEVLLSCCLLVVSGMLVRSVVKLNSVTYPFATEDVFVGFFNGDDKRYAKPEDMLRLTDRLRERWATVPGVRRVSIASTSPGTEGQAPLTIEGVTYATEKDHPQVRRLTASAEYSRSCGSRRNRAGCSGRATPWGRRWWPWWTRDSHAAISRMARYSGSGSRPATLPPSGAPSWA